MLELGVKFLISYFVGSLMGSMIMGKLRGGVDIRTMAAATPAVRTRCEHRVCGLRLALS